MPFPFIAAALLATFAATPALAQVEHDSGFWVNMTGLGATRGGTTYFFELQPRVHDGGARLDQFLVRGAVGRPIAKGLTLWQGYAHIFVPVNGSRGINEERSFQQLLWVTPAFGRGELQTRTRLEQRFRSDGRDVGHRARQMVRFEYPLGSGKGVRALASTEVFWALNAPDWRRRAGFDQLRTFVGAEVPFFGKSTIEAGYMNQTLDQPGTRASMNHLMAVSFFFRK